MNKVEKKLLLAVSLIFGWILSFPYESPVLYSLFEYLGVQFSTFNKFSLFAHAAGLLLGFLVLRVFKTSKIYSIITSLACIFIQISLLILKSSYFTIIITTISFIAGILVSSMSIYIKKYVLSENRTKFVSLALICSNILLTITTLLSTYLPLAYSYIFTLIIFIIGAIRLIGFPEINFEKERNLIPSNTQVDIKDYWILYVFIFIISINSGLMFQVIYPYIGEYTMLSSHYTNIPYMIAIMFFGVYSRRQHQNSLYIGLALWGVTFILLLAFGKSVYLAFVVISIMLFACGIFDCFVWSILSQNLNNVKNYVLMFGAGLFFNVLGIFVGSIISNIINSTSYDMHTISLLGLFVVMVCMIIILPLNSKLSKVIDKTRFLLQIPETINRNSQFVMDEIKAQLTSREYDIFCLHMQSYFDKEICSRLYISRNTVKTHNKNIYKKLDVSNRKELYNKYFEDYHESNQQ